MRYVMFLGKKRFKYEKLNVFLDNHDTNYKKTDGFSLAIKFVYQQVVFGSHYSVKLVTSSSTGL